jgi:hypothetical protein
MEPLTPWEEHLPRVRRHEIAELRCHWGDVYDITWSGGVFRATRLDNRAAVNATTAADLWEAIRDDYAAKPVPRDEAVGTGTGQCPPGHQG